MLLPWDIIGIVDQNGNTVVEYKYDAWGKPLMKIGQLASTLGSVNPFRYRGYVYDEETGLYYLRSRYYNPAWGRFVNSDTLLGRVSNLMSHNVFAYCQNSTVDRYDIAGKESKIVYATEKGFDESITEAMQKYLLPAEMYGYKANGYTPAKNGKPGLIDCTNLMIKIGSGNNSTKATYRYDNYTKKGSIEELGGIEWVTTDMELFQWNGRYETNKYGRRYMSMDHVGRVVVQDLGNGPELAVFQSVSSKLNPKDWRAYFYGDTGPNITSLTKLDGTTKWTHYAIVKD